MTRNPVTLGAGKNRKAGSRKPSTVFNVRCVWPDGKTTITDTWVKERYLAHYGEPTSFVFVDMDEPELNRVQIDNPD